MKKYLLAVALIGCLTITLAACGDSSLGTVNNNLIDTSESSSENWPDGTNTADGTADHDSQATAPSTADNAGGNDNNSSRSDSPITGNSGSDNIVSQGDGSDIPQNGGTGSSENQSSNNGSDSPTTGSFSREDYNKISTGMSYDEVVSIIGKEGTLVTENSTAGYLTQSYEWHLTGEITYVSIIFQNGNVVNKSSGGSALGTEKTVTLAQFNRVETGMTYEQVKEIFGFDGSLFTESSNDYVDIKMYMWSGDAAGSSASVTFQDGKVAYKYQYGLT